MSKRFRGYLPVVIDVETGGMDCLKHPILEIAAVIIQMDSEGKLVRGETVFHNVEPFEGAIFDQSSLDFTGIDPHSPLRAAISEREALQSVFKAVRTEIKATGCNRAVLVGHNAFFDMGFIAQAVQRANIKRNPFHPFTTFDTASLSGLAFGQTVLARAVDAAGFSFDSQQAHSAGYDAEVTADLFCYIVNQLRDLLLTNSR